MDEPRVTRRTYLEALLATGALASVAGCNSSQNDSAPTKTTDAPTTTSNQNSSITTPDQAPQILAHEATPQDNGTILAVHLEGKDDDELSLARIEYGEQTIKKTPDSASVALDDEFTGLGESTLDESSGQVTFLLQDTNGKETRSTVNPDETAPQLQTISARPTTTAGEITLQLEGEDNTGLEEIQVRLGGQSLLHENVSGQQSYTANQQVSLSDDGRFQKQTVTGSLADWNSNTTTSEADTYVRKYDVMDETRLDIGVEYFQLGEEMFTECLANGIETAPQVGVEGYGDPIRPETTSKHFDQMQGHGIGRVIYTFNGTGSFETRLNTFLSSSLIDSIQVEAGYFISPDVWDDTENLKENVVKPHMSTIKEYILDRENTATFQNRPTFMVDNAMGWVGRGDRIKDEWGSYESFIGDIRNLLKVNGKEPFIIAGMGAQGARDSYIEEHAKLSRHCDAVTNLIAGPVWGDQEDKTATQRAVLDWMEENYRGHREFARENDLEFFPRVFPGFDRRANTCWGDDELVPRSRNFFESMLQLADEYRTADRVNIFTWNDFTEGTAIEPGTWRGNQYGQSYVNAVKDFQGAN